MTGKTYNFPLYCSAVWKIQLYNFSNHIAILIMLCCIINIVCINHITLMKIKDPFVCCFVWIIRRSVPNSLISYAHASSEPFNSMVIV